MYKGLTQEIGSDFEYKIEGSIVVIETEAELKQREELVRLFEKNDLDIFLLNKEETLRKEPFVNPHILGSTFCPYEVMLTPVVGQITTDLITKGRSKLPIDDYRLSRYEKEVSP
jgi:L-2-hydroxyglutarate oxidase LhgO